MPASRDAVGEINSEMHSYKYTWIINTFNFHFMKTGEKIRSPEFQTTFNDKTFEWQIWLYPRGVKGTDGKSLSIALYNFSSNIVTADVSFGIVDEKNKVVGIKVTDKKTYDTRNEKEATWIITEFVKNSFISEDNKLIHDFNKIIFECEIKVYSAITKEREKKLEIEKELENKFRFGEFDKYELLMNDNLFSDVSFLVENKTLKAHKCILAKSSPVFAAMFEHEMREKRENTVRINDMKLNVFVEMLRFIYAGKINFKVDGIKSIAEELLVAADKYSVDGLKSKCIKLIDDNLCIDNAVEILVLADRHRVEYLKFRAMKLIVIHSYELKKVSDFKYLTETPDILYEVCHAIANNGKFLNSY